jgi:TonB family protein
MTRRPHGPTRHPARGGLIAGAIVVLAIGAGVLWSRGRPDQRPEASVGVASPIGPQVARVGPGPSAEEESGWMPVAPVAPPAARPETAPSPPRRAPRVAPPRGAMPAPPRPAPPLVRSAAPPSQGATGPSQKSSPPRTGQDAAAGGPETPTAGTGPAGPAPDPQAPGAQGAESPASPTQIPAAQTPVASLPAPERSPAPPARPPAPVLTPPVPVVLDPPKHPDAWRIVVETPGLAAGARPVADAARVRLRVLVRDDGTVGDVTIAVSSGRPDLDAAAAAAARGWRFQPARRDGVAIASAVLIWVAFVMAP